MSDAVRLAICAIFKDEGAYLAEWLAWHRHLGFSRFFLYDNASTDNSAALCQGDDITLTAWPGAAAQLPAYAHCLETFKHAADWIAFLDVDEFLYDPQGRHLAAILPPPDARLEGEPIDRVWCGWRMFGWKPHETRPRGGVLQNYCWRAPDESQLHAFQMGGKSLVRPTKVLYPPPTPHHVIVEGLTWADSGFVTHHYWTKSLAEARQKFARGRADTGVKRPFSEITSLASELHQVYDDGLARQAAAAGIGESPVAT